MLRCFCAATVVLILSVIGIHYKIIYILISDWIRIDFLCIYNHNIEKNAKKIPKNRIFK